MSEDKIEQLKEKLAEKKEKLKKEEQRQEELASLTHRTYAVFLNKDKKGRHFKMAKVSYNPETKKAVVEDVREFDDKTAGLSMHVAEENMEYLFNKCRKGE